MKFLVHATVNASSIATRLGTAEYSYFFLMRSFSTVLAELGTVIHLEDPAEADAIHARCLAQGEGCVLLSFAPPHNTPLDLACPVIPIFAWEFPDIPERIEETLWMGDPRHDWRHVLARTGRAITLSNHTREAVRRSLGARYPIAAIPSPLSPQHGEHGENTRASRPNLGGVLEIEACVADSWRAGLNVQALNIKIGASDDDPPDEPPDDEHLPDVSLATDQGMDSAPAVAADEVIHACDWDLPPTLKARIRLRGIVYTSVLMPSAGRKNLKDIITAFGWAFRDDPDVTLILKLADADLAWQHRQLIMLLTKLSPLKCRIIALHGYLSDSDYAALMDATTYYVNASLCEGLCLPLVEFLNHGIPAIAPDNTAMADYIRDDLAFVVASYPGIPTVWPHGDKEINRTTYHQIDWQSLFDAFRLSHATAVNDRQQYQRMSRCASKSMQEYCGADVVKSALESFLAPYLAIPPILSTHCGPQSTIRVPAGAETP